MNKIFQQEKICVISDIHCGIHQNSSRWHRIILDWASYLSTNLTSKGITDILILGDVFHYRDEVSVNTIHILSEILHIWSKFNITIIPGNHDCFYKDHSDVHSLSILKGHKNIRIIEKPIRLPVWDDKTAWFCPWGTSTIDFQDVRSDFIFGHFEINSFWYTKVRQNTHGEEPSSLLRYGNYILTGHFHQRQERRYENQYILYTGSPYQQDFGDSGDERGYTILNLSTGEIEFIRNDVSPKHIILTNKDNWDMNLIRGNIIRIKLTDSTLDTNQLNTELQQYNPIQCHFDVQFQLHDQDEEITLSETLTTDKIIDEFIQKTNVVEIDKQALSTYIFQTLKQVS